jgi:transposase-like protein
MSYEILIEETETIEGWTVCAICLNVERTATVARKRWRCPDCGIDASNNTQRVLRDYLTENTPEIIEKNLREWGNAKGVRAAYRMLRSARYKCLLTLGRRMRGETPPSTESSG